MPEATPRERIEAIVDEQLAAWDRDVAACAFRQSQENLDALRLEIVRLRMFYDPQSKTITIIQFPGETYVRPA